MDIKKFNQRMGRPKYSKGGYIKKIAGRKYFASGGIGGIADALGMGAVKANITPGTNAAQLDQAYRGANGALQNQGSLLDTLTPQAQTGVNAQNTVLNQELERARGAGPNPALNQLAETTGTNVSNEASLMAGARGSNANPGMMARNIGQVGANVEQGAVGQAATLGAEQQIAAQEAAKGTAGQQIGQTQNATTAFNTAEQNEQNILQNANSATNNSNVGMQSNMNNVNAQTNQGILGGITSGIGALAGGLFEKGGEVKEVHPDKKHKLEFIHKMAKMGLDHFDKGGEATPSPTPAEHSMFSFGAPAANAADVVPANVDKSKMKVNDVWIWNR